MPYTNKTINNIERSIAAIRKEYHSEEQKINEDENLSAAGKRNKIEELKQKYHSTYKDQLKELNETTAEEHSKLQGNLFDNNNKSTADKLAFDQAVMKFSDIQASRDEDLTDRVGQISSTASARALAKAAYDAGNSEALTAVYTKFDSLKEPLSNLSDFEDRYVHERMDTKGKMAYKGRIAGPPRPKAGV